MYHSSIRLMQGVRRWMGTQPPSSLRKSFRKPMSKFEAKHLTREVEPAEKNSTEYIVGQLMDPKVSDMELEQYEGYVARI